MSLGFSSISIAGVTIPPYIDGNTMEKLCSVNLACWGGDEEWVKKYYIHKQFPKAFVIAYNKRGTKYDLEYIVASGDRQPSTAAAKSQALNACKREMKSSATCTILFVNNSVFNKDLYKLLLTKALPRNSIEIGNSWVCKAHYYKSGNKCLSLPANSYKKGTSWACNNNYRKSGNKCLIDIPHNASDSWDGMGWTCNKNYYRNISKTACLKVPKNSTSSSLSNFFKCNTGYKKSGQKCILKIVIPPNATASSSSSTGWTCNTQYYKEGNSCKRIPLNSYNKGSSWACNTGYTKTGNSCIKVPANAYASGSTWACNNGYYKNSSTTGCLKVPVNATKYASDKGWSCNSGYTKTGTSCTNTAELERIKKAKQIAEEKLAKERKAAQLDAQNYFNDLEEFLKTNTSEYNITSIVTLIAKNKAIRTEPWNKVVENNFAELKSFASSSTAFRDYHQLKNDERQKAILNELDKANARLKNINAYLNFYVQNNITSDIAQDVLKQIQVATDGLQKQDLSELSKTSTKIEQFIAKNNLSKDYLAFVKSLSKNTPDEPEVTAQKIDATDLVNFDFMKKANRSDYMALINLTGKAPNALLDLEGRVVFENDKALSCFYQSKNTIKNDLKYYLYDKFSNKEFLIQDRGFECNQNNLLSYDLVIFEKGTLLKESKSYVASLAAAIAYYELQLFKTITKEDRNQDFAYRAGKVKNIIEGLEDEMLLGFGSLIIDNDNTTLCTDVEKTLGQASIMNLLSNEFTRMGYGKSVSNVSFNSVEDTFANVQRGRCGFIYAGEESLAKLLNALKSSGTKYDILPIWYSKKMVKNEQSRQESKNQSALIAAQKVKEQKDKEKELAKLREESDLAALKASGILKAEEQKQLQKRNRNIVESHLQLIEKETALLLDKEPDNTGPILNLYPSLVGFVEDQFKEGWELQSFNVEINDYGLSNYRNRIIETFITDINFILKNRVLGEYDPRCARVAIINDKEFEMLREPELVECKPGSLDSYKQKLDFQSDWIVE